MKVTIRSAGCVLFRRRPAGIVFLLIRNVKGHWDFPKGHVEPGESSEEAMRRETLEETGLKYGFPEPDWVRRIHYRVRDGGRVRDKVVMYRLAEARPGRVRLSAEHREARWVGDAEGMELLGFMNSRRLLRDSGRWLRRSAAAQKAGAGVAP